MTPQNENEIHIRPAEVGDICVLLEPTRSAEIGRLRQYQRLLQAGFGGSPIERIHLTCQRFADQDDQQLKNFQDSLIRLLAGFTPFGLTAVSLQTLYLPIRQTNILKWKIEVTEELRLVVALVEQALLSLGVEPLYRTGFVSSLVAALKDVPEMDQARLAEYKGFPQHLYRGERIVLSQICGPNEFKTLAVIPLNSGNESYGVSSVLGK